MINLKLSRLFFPDRVLVRVRQKDQVHRVWIPGFNQPKSPCLSQQGFISFIPELIGKDFKPLYFSLEIGLYIVMQAKLTKTNTKDSSSCYQQTASANIKSTFNSQPALTDFFNDLENRVIVKDS